MIANLKGGSEYEDFLSKLEDKTHNYATIRYCHNAMTTTHLKAEEGCQVISLSDLPGLGHLAQVAVQAVHCHFF